MNQPSTDAHVFSSGMVPARFPLFLAYWLFSHSHVHLGIAIQKVNNVRREMKRVDSVTSHSLFSRSLLLRWSSMYD